MFDKRLLVNFVLFLLKKKRGKTINCGKFAYRI